MNRELLENIVAAVWQWSEAQGFKGYNKHDGLNSPILRFLLGWAKWPRILAIQGVMRFPVNVRPLLLIPKTYNPKGIALFAMGSFDRYRVTGEPRHLERAEQLLELLMELRSPGRWSGSSWGYHYPWQDLGFYAPANTPNAVVTAFVCEAFLDAFRVTGNKFYLEVVESASQFFLNDLAVLLDEPEKLCLAYMPLAMKMRVMDVSMLVGAVLAQLGAYRGQKELLEEARRLVGYVVSNQTAYGAWYYTDPPEDSPVKHDNYHTGFILDALWRYMEATQDWRWKRVYEKGLYFYAKNLFNPDGSPRWMSNRDYPHDVHGAAQGILTFSLATMNGYDYQALVSRILDWAFRTLYSEAGRFYYQKMAHYTKRFTLLRWCNAWMFRAMSLADRSWIKKLQ